MSSCRERYQLREARRIRDLDRVLLGYQTYPQALTLVFDDLPGPDLLCHLTMDHFAAGGEDSQPRGGGSNGGAEGEVQWCVFVPGADSRERLISLLARQWEALCSRELPVELTGWLVSWRERTSRWIHGCDLDDLHTDQCLTGLKTPKYFQTKYLHSSQTKFVSCGGRNTHTTVPTHWGRDSWLNEKKYCEFPAQPFLTK